MEKEKMKKDKRDKLTLWQERFSRSESAAQTERAKMDQRTALYQGTRKILKPDGTEGEKEASVVRNIVAELVEAQVDSSFPMPKVTARREQDVDLAKTVEDFLRNETDRLPFERLNDEDERISPVQGGDIFLVEWDSDRHTHETRGELCVSLLHPKQVLFQDGVSNIEDMDYIIVSYVMTKKHVKEKYGVSMRYEQEEDPTIRGGNSGHSEELVTVHDGYYRNEKGGIGRFIWVNNTVLEDLEDYQARKGQKCAKCDADLNGEEKCPYCGSEKMKESDKDTFHLTEDMETRNGKIPAGEFVEEIPEGIEALMMDEFGNVMEAQPVETWKPTEIPYYKPDVYPIVIRKNVSAWGKVLGDSDVDKIKDQQNTIKKCDTRIQEKLDMGGSVIFMSENTQFEKTDGQLKEVRFSKPAERNMFGTANLQVDSGQDQVVSNDQYQHARNMLGVTDSMQGRPDPTATSGVAKQIAVAQSAGRLESKRIMKNAMYADLYEVMFKFLLAYSDEPRAVRRSKADGEVEYSVFNKYDLLQKDAAGEWYWNDDFLFSVDNSSALAGNREAMWQEIRMNLQTGAFGDPSKPETLILFWTMMAGQHYPFAKEIKEHLETQVTQQMQTPAGFAPESQMPAQEVPDTGVQDGAGSAMQMMGGMVNGM